MLISLEWIKDFLDIPPSYSAKDIAEKLSLVATEVEEVISSKEFLKKVVVGEVVEVEPHPNAEKLQLATVLWGEGREEKVVCGAENVRPGLKTPYAPLGTTLPGPLVLTAKKIRGVVSRGMLCSAKELGLGKEGEGIMELGEEGVVGKNLFQHLSLADDTVFDIDNKSITHRPDLWGHYAMAREIGAILQIPLKTPFGPVPFGQQAPPLKVRVDKESATIAYWGLSIDNVVNGPSPTWMQQRLERVGVRPNSLIVDISNFVMLELGIPNHIFDRQKIAGDAIWIRCLEEDTPFTTLDLVARTLKKGDTAVCDGEGNPLVIAGIMGGESSMVREETSNIFIEVAVWQSVAIRKTAGHLGLRTESSNRYEKGLDPKSALNSLHRLAQLVLQLCPQAQIVGEPVYGGEDLEQRSPTIIDLSLSHGEKLLGTSLDRTRVEDILHRLGFETSAKGEDILTVTVPSFRATGDIVEEVDLVEEIGRHIGYDKIIPASLKLETTPVKQSPLKELYQSTQSFLVYHSGCYELNCHPLIGEFLNKIYWPQENLVELANPASKEQQFMRPSLIPSLLQVAMENKKRFEPLSLF